MSKKIMLFSLQTFSSTGGIQKMTRTLGHSLIQIAKKNKWQFNMFSAYDAYYDLMPQYVPAQNFRAFHGNKLAFVLRAVKNGAESDTVILSHINLSVIGLLIKILNPRCQVYLIAHGIEIWRPVSFTKKALLKRCDKIICVSNYTKQQTVKWHNVNPAICTVLNNALDPFFNLPEKFKKPDFLLKKYNLNFENPILLTLTRLAETEHYKGHEQVIRVIGKLRVKFPGIKYILAGQYDSTEKIRINELISINKVQEQVILTGFIKESELPDYFLLADLFVLPSKKEGFGIVFIEALACGLPVICGNADGSVDAIRNGELGTAIDVENLVALEDAIIQSLRTPITLKNRQELQAQCLYNFNEQNYINNLERMFLKQDN
jgi:phosphatidylinositol alpha-1,6-mannosyltransferase